MPVVCHWLVLKKIGQSHEDATWHSESRANSRSFPLGPQWQLCTLIVPDVLKITLASNYCMRCVGSLLAYRR